MGGYVTGTIKKVRCFEYVAFVPCSVHVVVRMLVMHFACSAGNCGCATVFNDNRLGLVHFGVCALAKVSVKVEGSEEEKEQEEGGNERRIERKHRKSRQATYTAQHFNCFVFFLSSECFVRCSLRRCGCW